MNFFSALPPSFKTALCACAEVNKMKFYQDIAGFTKLF
jgi:hypothetical protein